MFSDINVLHDSATTGGIFSNQFSANLPRNLLAKKFVNRLRFDRIIAMSLWPDFFGTHCMFIALHAVRSREVESVDNIDSKSTFGSDADSTEHGEQ